MGLVLVLFMGLVLVLFMGLVLVFCMEKYLSPSASLSLDRERCAVWI
jgi:hypothetical protein